MTPTPFSRIIWIVLDSVGIGEMPDAAALRRRGQRHAGQYRRGSAAFVCRICAAHGSGATSSRWTGLARAAEPTGVVRHAARWLRPARTPLPATGKWSGFISTSRFRCFRTASRPRFMDEFERRIGRSYAREQGRVGHRNHRGTRRRSTCEPVRPIVYTSADSVFQVAAHEEVIPLFELYKICETAREILRGPYEVGRVIARPFIGSPGDVHADVEPSRLRGASAARACCSISSPVAEVEVYSVGKIFDVFLGRGIREHEKTKNNADGMAKTLGAMEQARPRSDFRQPGRLRPALRPSQRCGRLCAGARGSGCVAARLYEGKLRADDLAILTADHGCDPTTPSTDHSREYVPLLVYGKKSVPGVNLGVRATLSDIGQTVAENFSVHISKGTSFLTQIL